MTGQPRPADDVRQPHAAERLRTLAESDASAVISIPGPRAGGQTGPLQITHAETRAVDTDGTVVMLVSATAPAARAVAAAELTAVHEVGAVLEITDVAPVAVPHRIRGRGWISGRLDAVPRTRHADTARLFGGRVPLRDGGETFLRLEPEDAWTDDLWGACAVGAEEFAACRPDPLARHEAELLQHLAGAHQDQLEALCAFVGERDAASRPALEPWQHVAPVALDRFGIRLRFWRPGGRGFDARFDFATPVEDIVGLRHAMHQLFASVTR